MPFGVGNAWPTQVAGGQRPLDAAPDSAFMGRVDGEHDPDPDLHAFTRVRCGAGEQGR
ncbi:hypothetical protein HYG77_33700 (plasmid) [Rhodococcus sp. ZPP]|uniref:hypothetical protein n=1 Tax=Rhodococcus sp. ZPP TaxID=2749906 RepID=UPI001AD86685|nr:hypothetical protein [Rhodococcus sp. ZPP]QTJ70479.1 hypothetical protein HYG77_33700 [Rhodococcus sp. ZPP]